MGFIGFMTIWPELLANVPFGLIMTLILIPIIPITIVPIRSGQGGCKIKIKNPPQKAAGKSSGSVNENAFDRGDDRHWALGLFYHNPDDPAYIVEDRFGNNLGFNYSRLPVKIGVIITALSLIGFYIWLTVLMTGLFV